MPSAMSRPREPEGMVSISTLQCLPSRMIEPLPKWRSIWERAASSALDLSMVDVFSTTRRAAAEDIAGLPHVCLGTKIGLRPIEQNETYVHCLFSWRKGVV